MEKTCISKRVNDISVWITDDPDKADELAWYGSMAVHHKVVLKGHEYDMFIISPDNSRLKDDPVAALEFAKNFMVNDNSDIMD